MRGERDGFLARGAELVVIGNGTPAQAKDFKEEFSLPFPVLTDPELEAFRAAGLRRDLGSTLNPRLLVNAVRALRAGHRQTGVQGDPWQQGGAFVITPAGEVRLRHVSQVAGDHADPAQIHQALQRAG